MEDRLYFSSNKADIPSLDIQLLYLEHREFTREQRRSYHSHGFWQAELVLDGTVLVHFADQTITIDIGAVLIIPPGKRHAFEYLNSPTEYVSFKFSCSGTDAIRDPLVYTEEYGAASLSSYLLSILKDFSANQRLIAVHIQNTLKTLLEIEVLYGTPLPPRTIADQVRDVLVQSAGPFPSVETISRQLGLSRPYISRLLKIETGLSMKPFIDRECIRIAKQMLSLSDLTISEIAFQLGFKDLFSFSKFFKRLEHVSPTDYHRQQQTG
jgi:AraC-like DNA-binding protein